MADLYPRRIHSLYYNRWWTSLLSDPNEIYTLSSKTVCTHSREDILMQKMQVVPLLAEDRESIENCLLTILTSPAPGKWLCWSFVPPRVCTIFGASLLLNLLQIIAALFQSNQPKLATPLWPLKLNYFVFLIYGPPIDWQYCTFCWKKSPNRLKAKVFESLCFLLQESGL